MEIHLALEDARDLAAALSEAIEAAGEDGPVVVAISDVFRRMQVSFAGDGVAVEFFE
jgi:hypothetical protein